MLLHLLQPIVAAPPRLTAGFAGAHHVTTRQTAHRRDSPQPRSHARTPNTAPPTAYHHPPPPSTSCSLIGERVCLSKKSSRYRPGIGGSHVQGGANDVATAVGCALQVSSSLGAIGALRVTRSRAPPPLSQPEARGLLPAYLPLRPHSAVAARAGGAVGAALWP